MSTESYSNSSSFTYDEPIPNAAKFWTYLILLMPSLICSVFSLYYLLWNQTLRHALHNHAIIIFLLIALMYELTIYPWMLYFYHRQGIWQRTRFFCTIWLFIDWGLYYTQTMLFAWATIERHILIFHERWVSTKMKRLFIHYTPLIILAFYCLIYYIVILFYPPCKNIFDNYFMICVDSCLMKSFSLYTYDTIVHQISSNLIIVIFSIGLLIRIRWQKHRVGQTLTWRKHWKMTVQLLFISMVYLIFSLPLTIINFLDLFGVHRDKIFNFTEYALFLNYCTILLCPIASTLSLPRLRNRRKNIIRTLTQTKTIAPIGWTNKQNIFSIFGSFKCSNVSTI